MAAVESLRVVHLDPNGFDDLAVERSIFDAEFDNFEFDEIAASGSEIDDHVGEADILLTHYTSVPAVAMDATDCAVVARYSTGVDGIDVEAATARNIAVTNVPTYCDEEVGEHVVALTLALLRSLPEADAQTAAGDWNWRDIPRPRTANGLTFGCFAFGKKAAAAAERAGALGFDVIAHDPYLDDSVLRDADVEPATFDELVSRSDVLSLHAPLTDETTQVVDETVFERLPTDALLVNTARGGLVDEAALVDALDTGELAAAGLDVLTTEPPRDDNPLLGRDDTIVTPHAAWYSDGALERVRTQGTMNAIEAFRGNVVDGIVNSEVIESR